MIGYIYGVLIDERYIYVGQTRNIEKRFRQHKSMLLAKRHHNRFMQNLHNKYSIDSFEFFLLDILVTDNQNDVNRLEEYYISVYKRALFNVINICNVAANSNGVKRSEYTKEKCSIAKREHWTRSDYRENIINSHKNYMNNPDNMKRIVNTRIEKQVYKYKGLISPDGIVYENIKNYHSFCRYNNINRGAIYQVLKGNKEAHKGWKAL